MDKEIKEILLKSLEVRKNRLTKSGFKSIDLVKENIARWQKEIDTNQEYVRNGMVQMKVYKDTNESLIKQEKEWLKKSEKIVSDCEKAIDYIKNKY